MKIGLLSDLMLTFHRCTLKRRNALAKVLSMLYSMLKLTAMEYTANEVCSVDRDVLKVLSSPSSKSSRDLDMSSAAK
jgi:hypothetical protein